MAVAELHEEPRRPAMNQAGLWLFFLSETFLFAALATARFAISGTDKGEGLNQALGLGITTVLILSSLTAFRAEAAMEQGNRRGFQRFLLATIMLGLVFVGGVGMEWTTAEFSVSDPYGTAFFSMTGLHAAHVISGIVMLAMVYRLGLRGHFTAERHWGVEATVKYWHFVDVVWVFFYPILYLINV